MKQPNIINLPFAFLMLIIPEYALSYIGPGAGITAIGTVIALFGAILLAIVGFIWYPVKRMLSNKKQKKSKETKI